ncbi:MAG: trypsin-like peptidase domain-containing protein [Kiritimatiellia bacterium]
MKRALILFTILELFFCASTQAVSYADFLVDVIVTYQETDPLLPWQKTTPLGRHGYGTVIKNGHILTTESLVRNHTLIEIRRPGRGKKLKVSPLQIDSQANLAILAPPEDRMTRGLSPVPLASAVSLKDAVRIIQTDENGKVQIGNGKVIQVAVKQLPSSTSQMLSCILLTDLNVGGAGAPVILEDGSLAGLMISYNSSSRTGDMLPCQVLSHFVEDAVNPPYRGFASAGFIWSPLINPAKRRLLNVPDEESGILVLACIPGTGAAESLKPNDVILEWNGFAVDSLGYYKDPHFGRLAFSYLIKGRAEPGDAVSLRIVRDRESMDLDISLSRLLDTDALIPENITGSQPEHLVEGGFVLRELTGRYLRSHGRRWQYALDSRLVHMYLTRRYSPDRPGDRIVILSRVLPDRVNVGYQDTRNVPVRRVNGRKVRNMKDVFRIRGRDGHIERIGLQSMSVDLVLNARLLEEANERIARIYGLRSLVHRHE